MATTTDISRDPVMITRHIKRLSHNHDRYVTFCGYSFHDKWK